MASKHEDDAIQRMRRLNAPPTLQNDVDEVMTTRRKSDEITIDKKLILPSPHHFLLRTCNSFWYLFEANFK